MDWLLLLLTAGIIAAALHAYSKRATRPEARPPKTEPENHRPTEEAVKYGMLQVAETLRVAYARVVERKGCFVMAESELPASREKIKAALLLCARVRRPNGHLDEKLFNAVQIGYGSLADFVPDEDRARRARKFRDYLTDRQQERNPENLPWPAWLDEKYQQRIGRGEIDARAEAQKIAEKMEEIGPLDEVFSPSAEFGRLCDEFKERLNGLSDPERRVPNIIEWQRIREALLAE